MNNGCAAPGIPTCANKGLLQTVLRDTWGWDGFVVSDYDAWFFMSAEADGYHGSKYVKTNEDAAAAGQRIKFFTPLSFLNNGAKNRKIAQHVSNRE